MQTHQHFDEILRLKHQLGVKLAYENANLNNIAKELAVNKEKFAKTAESLTTLKPFIDAIDTEKQEVVDLELISQILTYRSAIKKGEERTEKGRTVVDNLSKEVDTITKEINKVDIKVEEIKSKLIDAKTLTAVELWFSANNALKKQLADRSGKLTDISKQIETTDNKFEELNYDKNSWKEAIEAQSKQLNEQVAKENRQKTQLEVKQKIAQFKTKYMKARLVRLWFTRASACNRDRRCWQIYWKTSNN